MYYNQIESYYMRERDVANSKFVLRFRERKRLKERSSKEQSGVQTKPYSNIFSRKMLSALSAELWAVAGLFCKCHSFDPRARAVVKTNLVGIGF